MTDVVIDQDRDQSQGHEFPLVGTIHVKTIDRGKRFHVPFVHRPNSAIVIRFAFDRSKGTVDFGLWSPQGWHGYSGGARTLVVLTDSQATPGYLQQELPVGEWNIEFSIYRAYDEFDITFEIHDHVDSQWVTDVCRRMPMTIADLRGMQDDLYGSSFSADEMNRRLVESGFLSIDSSVCGSKRDLPAEDGLAWYAGDFHSHSLHSDGNLSLDELAYVATANGLDFLAVTEHNTVSHQPYLRAVGARHSILLIPGQEVTTDWGHANVFGETGWIDFHQNPEQWIRCAESCCALMSINHPIADHCAWQWALSTLPPLLEFWHSTWYQGREAKGLVDTGMWALWQRWSKRASIIGGGDFHSLDGPFLPGTPTTWVAAEELSIQGIFDAVRRGRTAISLGLERLSPQTCGIGDNGREHEPLLLPVGASMMALECQHMQLVLPDGRRISIERRSQSFPQSLRHGIWRIEDDCGRVVAIAKTTGDCD